LRQRRRRRSFENNQRKSNLIKEIKWHAGAKDQDLAEKSGLLCFRTLQQIESGKAGDFSRKSDEELLAILNEPLDFDLESIALGNGSPSKH
jgi:transcriptional regulator with XRE-family HTH domain